MRWKAFDGPVNSDLLIEFLLSLIKDVGRKVYLIMDNIRVHHSKSVRGWLAELRHDIGVFYLPSYGPKLNLNEIANADLKQAVTKARPCAHEDATSTTSLK